MEVPACPTWCTDHKTLDNAGETVAFHGHTFYRQDARAEIYVHVSQHWSESTGLQPADCSIQTWHEPPAIVDAGRLRELAAALLAAADAVDSAGSQEYVPPARPRLVPPIGGAQ